MAKSVKIVSRENTAKTNAQYSDINDILNIFSKISKTSTASSVINNAFFQLNKKSPTSSTWQNQFYTSVFNAIQGNEVTNNLLYVPTNKSARLSEYERMALNSEIDACLDEIADNAVNYNERKQIVELSFNEDIDFKLKDIDSDKDLDLVKTELYKEFYKFISPLKLKANFHRYVKSFLKTGECCWENIIDKNNLDAGIIDFQFIPAHSFDFAYDKETNEKKGLWVKVLKTKPGASLNYDVSSAGNSSWGVSNGSYTGYSGYNYNLSALNRYDEYTSGDLIFLPFEQVTYVNSGEYSPNELIVYPLIEKARRPYNQLMCIEDSIIIYRLARAPTRLIFNVGVGMANNSKGAQQVQQLIRRYNVSKSYNPSTGTTTNSRDPHTMTESFWFMKSANGEGTDVQELNSSIDMGELPDLQYFQKKLWTALHVPAKRFLDAGEPFNRNMANEMSPAELRFCKYIMRILASFASAIKESFITHLKLIGLFDKLELDSSFFEIHFVNPLSYELYEQGRVLNQRVEMFRLVTEDSENFSKTLAMKKFLNFTQKEIDDNWIELEKEAIKRKIIESRADYIAEFELERFKQKTEAEAQAQKEKESLKTQYDTIDDIIDKTVVNTKKSQEVIQRGVEQLSKDYNNDNNNEDNQFERDRFDFEDNRQQYLDNNNQLQSLQSQPQISSPEQQFQTEPLDK